MHSIQRQEMPSITPAHIISNDLTSTFLFPVSADMTEINIVASVASSTRADNNSQIPVLMASRLFEDPEGSKQERFPENKFHGMSVAARRAQFQKYETAPALPKLRGRSKSSKDTQKPAEVVMRRTMMWKSHDAPITRPSNLFVSDNNNGLKPLSAEELAGDDCWTSGEILSADLISMSSS